MVFFQRPFQVYKKLYRLKQKDNCLRAWLKLFQLKSPAIGLNS